MEDVEQRLGGLAVDRVPPLGPLDCHHCHPPIGALGNRRGHGVDPRPAAVACSCALFTRSGDKVAERDALLTLGVLAERNPTLPPSRAVIPVPFDRVNGTRRNFRVSTMKGHCMTRVVQPVKPNGEQLSVRIMRDDCERLRAA